jgi:uncharacterized membrane protein
MPWNRWYSFKSYVSSSLWIAPLLAVVLSVIASRTAEAIERWLKTAGRIDEASAFFAMGHAGAQALLGAIVNMTLSFLVFTFGSLLVAIQVAGGQYTPRIIATTLLRDNAIRYTVGLFVLTLLFALREQDRMSAGVNQLATAAAAVLGISCIVAFLFLIDYAARMLRPVSLAERVGKRGIAVISGLYPELAGSATVPDAPPAKRGRAQRTTSHRGESAVVLAVNLELLVAEARRADGIVELAPQVGDFVAAGEPLFYLYGNAAAIDERRLRSAVAFGPERTMEQDPLFAFRIVVDIALKALSPAINDPTTAMLAVDQVHRLLRAAGQRSLSDEEILDASGQLRVILRTPNWEDFVQLAFREIRQCGAGSIQVARRLRAMVENLADTLPEHRHPALREELDLLDRAIDAQYSFPEDQALARIPDPQGLGGRARPSGPA